MTDKKYWGKLSDGREVSLFRITNKDGAYVELSEYGACIVRLCVPDRNGQLDDVVLGFDNVTAYEKQHGTYFGATVGRYANRIANGRFMLGGIPVVLACNDGNNHLHGGIAGFDRKLWHGEADGDGSVVFTAESADGEEGYPGALSVSVKFTFTDNSALTTEYRAKSTKTTVVNLTNHSCFNLKGHSACSADTQVLRINADYFTGTDRLLIPDGTVMPVECTPLDFRNYARINSRINFEYIQLRHAGGYDHNFVLRKRERNILSLAAELYSPESGRFLTVHTTMPGLQFYSGNLLTMVDGKGGALYTKRSGICLEPQFFPNSPEITHFPSPVLKENEEYRHITRYSFTIKELDEKCYL